LVAATGDDNGDTDPRQSDYLADVHEIYFVDEHGPMVVLTPLGVVLLTQCCDLARGGNGEAHVAKVVRLSGDAAANAKSGRTPRYIELNGLPESGLFADLGQVGGMTNRAVLAHSRQPAVPPDERHLLGQRVARRFGRFAYPDDVQPLLSWIVTRIRSKAKSEQSPLGRLLGRVATIRMENESGWDAGPWSLTLVLVLNDGELPTLPADPSGPGASETAPSGMTAIAKLIADLHPGAPELANLWLAFSEAFATEAFVGSGISSDIVSEFHVEAMEESEFSYARYRRSTDLDVDHVSGPQLGPDDDGASLPRPRIRRSRTSNGPDEDFVIQTTIDHVYC
jgi:hypothetical protein